MHRLLTGQPLDTLAPRMEEFNHTIDEFQQFACLLYLKIYQQTVENLQGGVDNLEILTGSYLKEEEVTVDSADNKLALAFFYSFKLWLNFFLENYEEAQASAKLAKQYADGMTAASTVATLNFYESLTCLAIASSSSNPAALIDQVTENQAQLKIWAKHAPENHQHRYALVEAERYRVLGEEAKASQEYDTAIRQAKENYYFNEEALAQELAGRFYLTQGRDNFARVYLGEAYYGYFHWGAKAKVKQLENKYPQFVGQTATLSSHPAPLNTSWTQTSANSTMRSGQILDLAAVLQASQAIAGEIVLDKLLIKLLQILMRSAGAQLGYLLLNGKAGLKIEASYDSSSDQTEVLKSLELTGRLPESVINFVQRTQESVVLRNAKANDNFTQDPYILENQTLSVLCAPLLNQGQLSAILYLENNLTEGAFTPDRLEILQLLSGQAAIAIDQARTYNNLEQRVEDRTQELSAAYDELQRTQEGLIQSEKMAALGQLIAGIAHELNTPLGAIRSSIGYTAKFLDEHLPTLPEFFQSQTESEAILFKQLLKLASENQLALSGRERRQARRNLTKALKERELPQSDSIASLLIDIGISASEAVADLSLEEENTIPLLKMVRQLSRVNESTKDIITASDRAGKIVFALKSFAHYDYSGELMSANIIDGIETVITLYQNQLKHGFEVIRDFDELPVIHCFFDELNQVWTNLIHNAIQAMEASGTLTISAKQEQDAIIVRISDTGKGIPKDIQAKIFDPFFTTKPPGEGSGLGLDIVKKIIDKHSGDISFESQPGHTVFTVKIPTTLTN